MEKAHVCILSIPFVFFVVKATIKLFRTKLIFHNILFFSWGSFRGDTVWCGGFVKQYDWWTSRGSIVWSVSYCSHCLIPFLLRTKFWIKNSKMKLQHLIQLLILVGKRRSWKFHRQTNKQTDKQQFKSLVRPYLSYRVRQKSVLR